MNMQEMLDVRGLEAPEPMMLVLDAIDTMHPGSALCVVIHREPYPLYAILEEQGFSWMTTWQQAGYFEIVISRE